MLIEWRLMHGSPCLMKIRYIIWKKAAKRKAKYEKFPKALQLCRDAFNTYELRSQRCQMCLPTYSLHGT
ncbi:sucrose nonfermenting protein [Trifolium repens]|nr:sucrose nonfermenting protein [Trifolium repens]